MLGDQVAPQPPLQGRCFSGQLNPKKASPGALASRRTLPHHPEPGLRQGVALRCRGGTPVK